MLTRQTIKGIKDINITREKAFCQKIIISLIITYRNSRLQMLFKIGALKDFAIFI